MRKYFFGLASVVFGALLLTVSGCSSVYDDPENWAVLDSDTPSFYSHYDLIFLYPSQEEVAKDGYLNWVCGSAGDELRRYVRMVISAPFGSHVRVFSPFIPLLGYREYVEILKKFKKERDHGFDFYKTDLKVPIDYMVDALNVYFSCYNTNDHPFVIYAQGQGALVLYEAMKRCGKVKPSRGFVAGYFFGLPGVTDEEIVSDFYWRGIKPAHSREGVGVIAVCNTVVDGDPLEKTLAMPGGAVINPLNWRIDATPAEKESNPGALFFDHKESDPTRKVKLVPRFCGATVDSKNGVVKLTGIPQDCKYKVDEGHFSSDAWGIFAKSVSINALERVFMYRYLKNGFELPE